MTIRGYYQYTIYAGAYSVDDVIENNGSTFDITITVAPINRLFMSFLNVAAQVDTSDWRLYSYSFVSKNPSSLAFNSSDAIGVDIGIPTIGDYPVTCAVKLTFQNMNRFHYTVTTDGGVDTCSIADGSHVTVDVQKILSVTAKTGYALGTIKLDGIIVTNGYAFSPSASDHTIEVATSCLTTTASITLNYSKSGCLPKNSIKFLGLNTSGNPQPSSLGVCMGGYADIGKNPMAFIASEGTVTETYTGISVGKDITVWAMANDVRTRLASLVVNGNDYVENPAGGSLVGQFVYTAQPAISGGLIFEATAAAISIEATFITDMFCYSGKPILPIGKKKPPILPGPGGGGGGQPPDIENPIPDDNPWNPWPFPVPPNPPAGYVHLTVIPVPINAGLVSGGGYYQIGKVATCAESPKAGWKFFKWWGGGASGTASTALVTMNESKTVFALFDPIPGAGGDSGGNDGGSSEETNGGGDGGGTTGDTGPFGTCEKPLPIDWDSGIRGIILRWRDNGGRWTKEHKIMLGTQGDTNLYKELVPHGIYNTRQYEIVNIDAVPFAVVYLEDDPEELE